MNQGKGRISIYSHNHTLLESRPYYTIEGRITIMSQWLSDYEGTAAYFHVYPYALDKAVTKEVKKQYTTIPIEPTIKFERPKSEYNNLPTYNYKP